MNPYDQEEVNTESLTQSTAVPTDTTGASVTNVTVAQAFGFFNIIVGVMLVIAILLFLGGFIVYLSRLGLEGRVSGGLRYMYRGIAVLIVLVILLGIVNFLQFHPEIVFAALGIVIVAAGAWAAIKISQQPAEEEH